MLYRGFCFRARAKKNAEHKTKTATSKSGHPDTRVEVLDRLGLASTGIGYGHAQRSTRFLDPRMYNFCYANNGIFVAGRGM